MPGAVVERAAAGLAVMLGATACTVALAAGAMGLPPLVSDEKALGAGWRRANLPAQTLPATAYTAERIDGRLALRVEARASYGNLVHDMPPVAAPRTLAWSWRLQQPNPAAELRQRAGDDTPVKVCMSFDLPLERVPFVERSLLRLARLRSGEPLPAATLCWVWSHREAPGELIENAYTRRVRTIVLRTAADAPGQWLAESRDVAADFRRAFGDESATLPPLVAVIVAGDADNTQASSVAHVAELRFAP